MTSTALLMLLHRVDRDLSLIHDLCRIGEAGLADAYVMRLQKHVADVRERETRQAEKVWGLAEANR